ncbi:DUF5995 family protein [Owenweeksia hongkongensis]|uniref:DUF5995 family protein n=1 Tax=Owenweeksia hongkongensis TaxID=253245 RepID=UPI003A926512
MSKFINTNMTSPYSSIDEVLAELDSIIDDALSQNSYLALFAYVYRRTTAQIKAEIEAGSFEDPERMTTFDINFASLYINAYRNYFSETPVTKCWQISFDARNDNITILQHILLGMNAHINLDLAIAASSVMRGQDIAPLERDFNKVNEVLGSLVDELQGKLGKVSFLMFLVDFIGREHDENIINFGMLQARGQSWKITTEFWELDGDDLKTKQDEVDYTVSCIAQHIRQPKTFIARGIFKLVRRFEEKDLSRIIEVMRS